MIKFKEFNLRDRANIVSLAQECSKSLSAQPLIDYFHKVYRTKFESGKTIINKIIDSHYPNSSERFRDEIQSMFIEFIFSFEGVTPKNEHKEDLRELFRDFFIFHNDANKNTSAVDAYFDEWYDVTFGVKSVK